MARKQINVEVAGECASLQMKDHDSAAVLKIIKKKTHTKKYIIIDKNEWLRMCIL